MCVYLKPGAKLSKQLRKVRLTIGVEETCARYFVDDNYICVVHPLRGTGSVSLSLVNEKISKIF